eukprot:8740669-Alexandrium_andersonii.AAC.1
MLLQAEVAAKAATVAVYQHHPCRDRADPEVAAQAATMAHRTRPCRQVARRDGAAVGAFGFSRIDRRP